MKSSFYRVVLLFLIGFVLAACESNEVISKPIPDLKSPGGKLLKKYCSACHGAPHPSVHKADEWKNVVNRMQTHRIKKAYNPLTDDEKSTLIKYLEDHAKV